MTPSKWRLALAWLLGTVGGGLAVVLCDRAVLDLDVSLVQSMLAAGALSTVALVVILLAFG